MAAHPNDICGATAAPASSAPYVLGEVITPGTPYTNGPARAVWVGGAGNVVAIMWPSGTSVTFTAVGAGTLLPICTTDLTVTVTTATNLVALY